MSTHHLALESVSLNAGAAGARRVTRPTFGCAADARKDGKIRLAAAFRAFAHYGFDEGVTGHISWRDPELADRFWVNPLGLHFSEIRARDLILVNRHGEVLEGEYPVNRAAFAIHAEIHCARPDVMAAAHAHSMYGKTWSSLGRRLDPITQDACAFYGCHGIYEEFHGVALEDTEGARIAAALGASKALILKNHGLLTVGSTVDVAAWLFIAFERCCQSQLLAEAAGVPQEIDPGQAAKTRDVISSDLVLWGSFQPLFHLMLKCYPDLADS